MDAATLEKLFTPFFSSKGDKGTGLGLFIANKIVEQHGGRITVSSAPGRGSLFRIGLPTAGQHAPSSGAFPALESAIDGA
jgi:signal transduction histidine kinase